MKIHWLLPFRFFERIFFFCEIFDIVKVHKNKLKTLKLKHYEHGKYGGKNAVVFERRR